GEGVFIRMSYSSTRTRTWTLLIRPRTWGLSLSSRTSFNLFKLSALTDRRCFACEPRRPLTRRTLTGPALVSILAMLQVLHLLAAPGRDAGRRVHVRQALERGADEVDRVARAGRLRQHVLHAHRLEHGAHRAAGDHAGTFEIGRAHV